MHSSSPTTNLEIQTSHIIKQRAGAKVVFFTIYFGHTCVVEEVALILYCVSDVIQFLMTCDREI